MVSQKYDKTKKTQNGARNNVLRIKLYKYYVQKHLELRKISTIMNSTHYNNNMYLSISETHLKTLLQYFND